MNHSKFDAKSKTAKGILSHGGSVLSTTETFGPTYAEAKSNTAHSSGQYAMEFLLKFDGAPDFGQCGVGFAHASWVPKNGVSIYGLGGNGSETVGNTITEDGWLWPQASYSPLPAGAHSGRVIQSGHRAYAYEDIDAGKGWLDNESQVTAADREAGTNPDYTFPPGSARVYGAAVQSRDGGTESSVEANPAYASGRFDSWD